MKFGLYGFLIIFGAFVLLLMLNPKMSCFGKKLKSPFYPLLRRKRMARERELDRQARLKQIKTEDYGFKLDDNSDKPAAPAQAKAKEKAEDYGFKLD
jgi:hypothetical protein